MEKICKDDERTYERELIPIILSFIGKLVKYFIFWKKYFNIQIKYEMNNTIS